MDELLTHHATSFGLLPPLDGWWTIERWRQATMFWLKDRADAFAGFGMEDIHEFLENWRSAQVSHIVIVAALSVMSDALCVNLKQVGRCTIGEAPLTPAVSLRHDSNQPSTWGHTIVLTLGYDMNKHFVALIATAVEDTEAAEATAAEAKKAEARAEASREVAAAAEVAREIEEAAAVAAVAREIEEAAAVAAVAMEIEEAAAVAAVAREIEEAEAAVAVAVAMEIEEAEAAVAVATEIEEAEAALAVAMEAEEAEAAARVERALCGALQAEMLCPQIVELRGGYSIHDTLQLEDAAGRPVEISAR